MENKNFKIGSQVRLKSGGPKMTIASVDHGSRSAVDSFAECTWFVSGEQKKSRFNFEMIVLDEEVSDGSGEMV